MWDWDPSEGDRTPTGSAPTLVPSKTSPSQPLKPQPVVIPNVQGLKQQFLQQQSLLTEMKETLRENDANRATKEKQLKMYEKKLSQIKNRQKTASKNSELTVPLQYVSPNKEVNPTNSHADNGSAKKIAHKGKMSELQKRLEENKIKFEERAEHGITETKKIESMMEQLRTQVQQSDATIHELQKNIDIPVVKLKATSRKPQKPFKEHPLNISKWTQTQNLEHANPRIEELEVNISELMDTIKNQASVIEASKRAANLLSKDLSQKEKVTVGELEGIKCELLEKQSNFRVIEAQLKAELNEKDNRITYLDEQLDNLSSKNGELTTKNSDIEKKLLELLSEKEVLEKNLNDISKSCFVPVDQHSVDTGKLEEKIAELTKEIEDSNKLMIRLKLDHKNKLKAANKTLEKLKQSSDDKKELISSEKKIEELSSVISKLKDKITELEDEKVTILTDKQITSEELSLKNNEITNLKIEIDDLQNEKKILSQNIEDLNMLVDNLNAGHSADLECFQIPGDTVSRQFDVSNESVQDQIGNLVKEKQELLEKLKNLAGSELLEVASLTNQGHTQHAESVGATEDKADSSQVKSETKIKPVDRKGSNNLKNKIKKLELELKNEKEHVEALNVTIKINEEQIQFLNEKISNFESDFSILPENINVLETQQACLSLENLLLQKTQQCEHLRTENLEVVHQLSEEKVLRTRAEEETEIAERLLQQTTALNLRITLLEEEIAELKGSCQKKEVDDFDRANIVIASKDTEIFNLENALADKTERLDTMKDELNLLQQNINDVLKHFENNSSENLSGYFEQVNCPLIRKLIEVFNAKDNQRAELERFIKEYTLSYDAKTKELSEILSSKSSECQLLGEECHHLQVMMENTLVDSNLKIRERDAKIDKLSKMLNDEKSKLQNQELLTKQRDEALLRAEETEKVLQSTWAERNELIQSRDHICQQLNEAKRSLAVVGTEKDNALSQCKILSESLDQSKAEVNFKHLLDTKLEELSSMTMKAKKLAANLKKKTQIEKDLLQQVTLLTTEKDEATSKLSEQSEIFDKFQEERLKNDHFIIIQNELVCEKQCLVDENQKLMNDNRLMTEQFEVFNLLENQLRQDLNTLLAEKENLILQLQTVITEKAVLEKFVSDENLKSVDSKQFCDSLLAENNSLKQNIDSLHEKWTLELSEKESAVLLQKELIDNLNATKNALDEKVKEKQILQAEGMKWMQEKDQLINQYQSLQCNLDESEKIKESLSNEVEKLKSSCERLIALETENKSLMEKLSELVLERDNLEKELKSNQNLVNDNDDRINDLSVSISTLQAMLVSLQEEKSKLEDQWVVFGENSKTEVEKYVSNINHLEKQVNNFNIAFDAEVQKNNALKSELEERKIIIERLESEIQRLVEVRDHPADEKIERKKKKSVTFRTDDTDYIKELRGEVATLQRALENSDATVGELKAALDQENPDTNLVSGSAQQAPKTFDINLFEEPVTTNFFSDLPNPEPSDPFNDESLTWDDSWGAEGHLEAEHQAISQKPTNESLKITELESEIKSLYTEKESLLEDHRVLQVKYTKVIKKLKEQKLVIDRLQSDIKIKKSSASINLDEAIIDELRAEIKKAETRENDLRKELESLKLEKESFLKNIDVLNAGNERFLELKERQDKDAAVWLAKHTELRTKISELEEQLDSPAPDDSETSLENRELKNLIEGLEWKVSELTEMVEEKDEEVERLIRSNQEMANGNSKSEDSNLLHDKLKDAEQQLNLLITENDALQSILNSQKLETDTSSKIALQESSPQPSALYQLFTTEPNQPNFPCFLENQQITTASVSNISNRETEIQNLKHLILTKDDEIQRFALELQREHSAFEAEKEILLNQLSTKDEEIVKFSHMVADAENIHKESKIELERAFEVNRLQSDRLFEDKLNDVRKSVEGKYQSLLKNRDAELEILRDSLGTNERDLNESQMTNDELVKKLKEQLRELDSSSTRALEEKEIENRELSAECGELRELCILRENTILHLQSELSSVNDALTIKQEEYNNVWSLYEKAQSDLIIIKDSLEAATTKYQQAQSLLEERERELFTLSQSALKTKETNELKNLGQTLGMINNEINLQTQQSLSKESEIEELKEALAIRDKEVRELRNTLQTTHDEIIHFRNFDNQLKEIRLQSDVQLTGETTEIDWTVQEAKNLSKLLQSDLDNALYLLHQRDVRCDELTFELTQLLEERDALQLRLSAEIRKNSELARTTSMAYSHQQQTQTDREADGQLAHKLSELHSIEYGRDINIHDDSVQRYRDQMEVLARDTRLKANTVFDV